MHRCFLSFSILTPLLLVGMGAGHARSADPVTGSKPNFIYINIDDLGYADVGCYGSTLNKTPNIDRLAKEGLKLTSFYTAPVCTPSRASLMTGSYPKRVGLPQVIFPASHLGLNSEEETLPEQLKKLGYATACVGKWHLGDQPEFLPGKHGFDYYYGLPYSNDMGPSLDGAKTNLNEPAMEISGKTGTARNPKAQQNQQQQQNDALGVRGPKQPPLPLLENDRVIERVRQTEQQALVEKYTVASLKFVEEHQKEPFFLYLPHSAVHFPLYPSKDFLGKSGHGLYSDWIEEVDASVGRLVEKLKALGLDKKTLVVFASDNGGTPRAVNSPLRGNKTTTWEGGVRSPTIAWWPGTIPANASSDEITSTMDVLPTFVKLAQGEVATGRKIDGMDLSAVLKGAPGAKGRDTFYYYKGPTLEGVRQGRWKLSLLNNQKRLYDLVADVGEATDVAAANPDVVTQLEKLVEVMGADLGLDGKQKAPGQREPGRVAEPKPLILGE
ncbi:MAG: sulfatase [Verrucomicrobium sp.]